MMSTIIGFAVTFLILFILYRFLRVSPETLAKANERYNNALAEYTKDESAILSKYWDDENRFKLFKETISDEKIIGISSCLVIPSTMSKLKESFISGITNVKKIDMSLYYLVVTKNNLHLLAFNGEEAYSNLIFPFSEISKAVLKNTKSASYSNPMKLLFEYANDKYEIECYGTFSGYPKFEVDESATKHMTRSNTDTNFNPYKRKFFASAKDLGELGGEIDMILRQRYNKALLLKLEEELGVTFPEIFKM